MNFGSGLVEQFSPDMQARVAARLHTLDETIADGRMDPSWFQGKRIIDWEAGDCAFAVALYLRGAAYVVAIDTWLMPELIPSALKDHPSFYIAKQSIQEFSLEPHAEQKFDLIFANTVTEHLQVLPTAFEVVKTLLTIGGIFVTNHDNYFHPVGHHDHGMLYYSGSRIVFQGIKCWDMDEKCQASAGHRENLARTLPWTWGPAHEAQRCPENCSTCPYFKRSHPWAHLLYQDEFLKTWGVTFTTHPDKGTINKINPFQLRQFIIEAGFSVVHEHHSKVQNEIPLTLLGRHSAETLTTSMVWIAAVAK